jgi:hypothetical protein
VIRVNRFHGPAPSTRAASCRSAGMRVSPARIISAMKGNQRQELMKTSVAKAVQGVAKKPTGRSMTPSPISAGFTTPPEVEKSQRQIITTTTVGTIQLSTIHVRAIRTPGNFWCRISAAPSASAVWSTALAATQTKDSHVARQKAALVSTLV